MPNGIKYSASPQTLALKKGNWWIGTGDVDKGPTITTDYWAGITPPTGGYAVYLPGSQGPNIYTPPNDSSLIQITNELSGQTFATGPSALNWYNSQSDKMVANIDYPPITTNGLHFMADAGFTPSYPRGGTGWYGLASSGGDAQLVNGPTYGPSGGGSVVYDGSDDYALLDDSKFKFNDSNLTYESIVQFDGNADVYRPLITIKDTTQFFNYGPNLSLSKARSGYFGGIVYAFFADNAQNGFGIQDTFTGDQLAAGGFFHFTLVLEKVSGFYEMRLYRSGFLVASTVTTATSYNFGLVSDANQLTSLGLDAGTFIADSYFRGNYSVARIYNRALSTSEVLQNYQVMLPRYLGQNVVTSGLTFYEDPGFKTSYPGPGSTSLFNVAGASGGNGSLNNGVSYSTSTGGTFVFDGSDDFITLSYTSSIFAFGTSDFSFTVWFNPNSNSSFLRLFSIGSFGNAGNFQLERQSPSVMVVHINDVFTSYSSSTPIGSWQYFTIVRSSGVVTVYQNGVSIGSATQNGTVNNGSNPTIGNNGTSVSVPWNGSISVVSIYNRALQASEVLYNYNSQKSRYGL